MLQIVKPVFLVLAVFFFSQLPLSALDLPFSDNVYMSIKGDVSYNLKVRTEDPKYELMYQDEGFNSTGDKNFEKGDIVNNKGMVRTELLFEMPYVTLFGKGEAFYDHVYNDDSLYPEGGDEEEAKRYAAYYAEFLEYYLDLNAGVFTLRAGRQIVEWGESIAPVFAPGVNIVNPYFGSKAGAAGYSFRDYKVPVLMAWASIEILDDLAIEGIYQPDFEPKYTMPVVGTYTSFVDVLGFGAQENPFFKEVVPEKFEDKQQYGGAARIILPFLANFELGLYYLHYLDRAPSVTFKLAKGYAEITYEEIDMYGLSFSQAIEALDLNLQINGEVAYRPNDTLQRDLIAGDYKGLDLTGVFQGQGFLGVEEDSRVPAESFDTGRTISWVFGGSKLFTDFLAFTPWLVSFNPMFEFYGVSNLDYEEDKLYTDPEHMYFYTAVLQFITSDMIDNTTLNLTVNGTGTLHEEQRSLHRIGTSITAKYGDSIGIMLGYDYITGDVEEERGPNNSSDRDAFSFQFTLYLI